MKGFCWYVQHFRNVEGPSFQRGSLEPFLMLFGAFWRALGCSGGSLAGLLGSLGVLWVSLGRPLVPQGGLLVSLWRPLGCVGCLLGAPWCLKVVFWAARGWLFGSLGVAWCVFWWPSGFLADSCGVSEGWPETQHKNWGKSSRNASGTHPHARNILHKTALPVPCKLRFVPRPVFVAICGTFEGSAEN